MKLSEQHFTYYMGLYEKNKTKRRGLNTETVNALRLHLVFGLQMTEACTLNNLDSTRRNNVYALKNRLLDMIEKAQGLVDIELD
jgi:hypothetical protein